MVNVSDEQQIKQRQKTEEAEQTAEQLVMIRLTNNPDFIVFIRKMLEITHPYRASWGSGGATAFAYLEGERHIGLQLLDMITKARPNDLPVWMREQEIENG